MSEQHDNDVDFGLKEPFDIDGGELDGIAPKLAFVLGVEWQMVSAQLDSGDAFERPIHPENESRIKRSCVRCGRRFRVGANGEHWRWLVVSDSEGNFPEAK